MVNNDLKFFTNEGIESSLYDRFKKTLKHTKYFDILVGYFRSSGFHRLYEEFESIEKVRILVGLNVDQPIFQIIEQSQKKDLFDDYKSSDKIKDNFTETLSKEIETAEDKIEIEEGILKFVKYLEDGKIEIKAHPSQNIHAKVYIIRHDENAMDYGRVITGSSNFSENGLIARREFNVELKDQPDVAFALKQFEDLWAEGVDLTKDYIDTVKNKSSFREDITPYDLYLKFLYEYFKEEINDDRDIDIKYPSNFMELKYQKEAVINARRILKEYNGVFLSDVVGLGKTYITSMLMQTLNDGRKLIICPPALMSYWNDTLNEFFVPGFDVVSSGGLEKIIKKGYDKYDYIIIDEAHNFRNEMTMGFDNLYKICKNKKVVLVSATPLNNSLRDIEAQLKLFMNIKNSPIPGMRNLEKIFKNAYTEIDKATKGTAKHIELVRKFTTKIREEVLRYIMVRRTRTEIKTYYQHDMQQQGLSFPELEPPRKIVYEFNDRVEKAFDETIELLKNKDFKYSRYTPLLYWTKPLNDFEQQQQKNTRDFMKRLLVKRLESSFYAFKKTLTRFIASYEDFIKMYGSGTIYIGKANIFEMLDDEDFEKIDKYIARGDIQTYSSDEFKAQFLIDLNKDLELLNIVYDLWKDVDDDPKLEAFTNAIIKDNILRENKLIIFTESKETSDHLYANLSKVYSKEVFSISGAGGLFCGEKYNFNIAKDLIEDNYKPQNKKELQKDDIRILITTDVLAEGVNLHRSNVIINYDLPWNPTRVLQRVGRINRVGTEHKKVYIFNFFPTAKSEIHLGLEANIISKINAFHSALGEDARYLSEEELLEQHGLTGKSSLGEKRNSGEKLYDDLSNLTALNEEEKENSMLGFIKLLRDIRDKKPELFKHIKMLPKKIRSTQQIPLDYETGLLTFFRKGTLKKFVYSTIKAGTEDLTFMEAIHKFECKQDEKTIKLPKDYYDLLTLNKKHLQNIAQEDDMEDSRGTSNISKITDILGAIQKLDAWTDDDLNLIVSAKRNILYGNLSKFKAKKMLEKLKNTQKPQQILGITKDFQEDWQAVEVTIASENKNEVILSKCFQGSK